MAKFIGRERELARLTAAFESPESAFIPIYGRRRVGKSELILKFMEGKPGIYHLGQQSSSALQVRAFLVEASRALDMPLLADLRATRWRDALLTVAEQWRLAHPDKKLILALDEFQWMAQASDGLPAVLQACWDQHWRDSGHVMLLLCGSYLGFMEREVLGKDSPLFGRRTAQILLQPFAYLEAAQFFRRWSTADRAKAYFIVGGLPQYLQCLDDSLSIRHNIQRHILDEFAPLFQEPSFLLREELRDVANYHAVLFAVANKAETAKAIFAETRLRERSLHYYLDELSKLGFVRRRYPLDRKRINPKQMRFGIDDPLLKFWFRYVFPNTSLLRSAARARGMCFRSASRRRWTPGSATASRDYAARRCRSCTRRRGSTPASRSASSGTRRRRSTSSVCATTTGRISANASGAPCVPPARWRRNWIAR